MTSQDPDGVPPTGTVNWLPWFLGAALVAGVVVAAFHVSQEAAFVRLAEQARPSWLVLALLLQIATYFAQGGVWRRVGVAAGWRLALLAGFELSLAKLFADQALPSAGLSGSILVAKALERRGMPPGAVKATVLLNLASYHLAYVLALALALMILAWQGESNHLVLVASVLFLLFSIAVTAGVLALSGRPQEHLPGNLDRFRVVRTTMDFVTGANAQLVRNLRLLTETTFLQGAIFILDAATIWFLIHALGARAPVGGVFSSFMIASLFRTVGILPGGLGTFEATSVLTLRLIGLDVPVALSATLLFRGLSFWLPMVPGYWLSHRVIRSRANGRDDGTSDSSL